MHYNKHLYALKKKKNDHIVHKIKHVHRMINVS
jgi:hypothetical protein